jgi:hypothetical protein
VDLLSFIVALWVGIRIMKICLFVIAFFLRWGGVGETLSVCLLVGDTTVTLRLVRGMDGWAWEYKIIGGLDGYGYLTLPFYCINI